MADDQQSKTTTIDDLVKELSKNNNSNQPSLPSATANQEPPSNLPGVKIDGKPLTPPAPSPVPSVNPLAPSASGPSQSQPSQTRPEPPRPSQAPQPQPPARPSFQEYKSSIRTMGEDISSIKSGQKPSGVDIPRKITPDAPRPLMPGIQKPTAAAPPGGPMPSSIGLGRAEKTEPLPFAPMPKKPEAPKPPEVQPSIIVPGEKKQFPGLRFLSPTLYMLIAGILVVGGFLYWFFILRISGPEVVVYPTQSPTLTATPPVKSLSEIFESSPVNFEVSSDKSINSDFKTFVNASVVPRNEFSRVSLVEDIGGALFPISFLDMFDRALATYPIGLKDNITDSAVLVYGQSESFKTDGTVDLGVQNLKKTSLVARVKNKTMIQAVMANWEFTVADDLADFMFISDTAKEASVNFLDNMYRSISIRYKNFPFPDSTIDYSIVDSGGQNYLVISGSREAMYATIDVLLAQ